LLLWTFVANAHAAEEGGAALIAKLVLWGLIAGAVAAAGTIASRARAPEPIGPSPGASNPALITPILGRSGSSGHLVTPGPDTFEAEGVTAVRQAPPAQTNVFGRYVLLDRLGEGGMAEVYTAVAFGAENFRRTFVVKRLRPEMAREASVVSAFIDEANMASSLVHSNIVPVFDFGKVGDEYFLAQEYILGRDLGRITRRSLEREGKPIPAAQVFFVASEVLKALDYAHGRTGEGGKPLGIVHRDVSPNNILVSARGEVKLFDFGIAKAEGRLTQTQAGVVKGNVRFMSPEQARGLHVDSRSDLFSLGLVVYHALAGDALYDGSNSYELLMRAAQGPGPAEMAKIGALGEPAAHILMRALQPDAGSRYQSAAEFATALHPYLGGAAASLVRTMEHFFAADIRDEEARFASAMGRTGTTGERAAIK
jgi:serine/threonine protein kinase